MLAARDPVGTCVCACKRIMGLRRAAPTRCSPSSALCCGAPLCVTRLASSRSQLASPNHLTRCCVAALKRQLDLEHVRVETENMEQHRREGKHGASGIGGDGAGDNTTDAGEMGVSDLLLSCNQVCRVAGAQVRVRHWVWKCRDRGDDRSARSRQ